MCEGTKEVGGQWPDSEKSSWKTDVVQRPARQHTGPQTETCGFLTHFCVRSLIPVSFKRF